MLQTKSFKFSEGSEISEFLKNHRIANGGDMLTSNGEIIIPFDDGLPPTTEQKIIDFKMLRNNKMLEADVINHSKRVSEIRQIGLEKAIAEHQENINYTPKNQEERKKNKKAEDEVARLTRILDQTKNQILMSQAELTNIMTEVAVYDESIANLEGTKPDVNN